MAIDMFESLKQLIKALREERFDANEDNFRGQVGLIVAQRHKAIRPADFFPLWELNQNLDLVARRDFAVIKAKRSKGWSPVLRENKL